MSSPTGDTYEDCKVGEEDQLCDRDPLSLEDMDVDWEPTPSMNDPLGDTKVKTEVGRESRKRKAESDKRRNRKRPKVLNYRAKRQQRCDLCLEKIPDSEIVQHLEAHQVKDYITPCSIQSCKQVFSCRGKMENHLRTHKERRSLPAPPRKCETCQLELKRLGFWSHIFDHEVAIQEKSLPCPIPDCSQRFALRQSVEQHLMSHDLRVVSEQPCPICEQSMGVSDMERHLKEDHKLEQTLKCKHCPFTFSNWELLLDHINDHRPHASLTCDLCGTEEGSLAVSFKKHEMLCQHYFKVHQVGKQYLCEHCDKEFYSKRMLDSHLKLNHSGPVKKAGPSDPKKYYKKCDLCPDLSFSGRDGLLTHQIKMHGAPPLNCKYCSETFTCGASRVTHERKHLGLGRGHKCGVDGCEKAFKGRGDLTNHRLQFHSDDPGLNPLSCGICGKIYAMKHSLQRHMDRIHLGKEERPVCEQCGESFASMNVLKRHKLIHGGDRPQYPCHICGQTFHYKDVLNTHLRGHEKKGDSFKPNGPMKNIRKRVARD